LAQHVQYVHTYLLAKFWHTVQVLPPLRECINQIVSAIAWFIWRGAIFRLPPSTLQRRKEEGMEPNRCKGKVSGIPDNPDVDTEPTCGVSVCGVATSLETAYR
jgi:hypothetical protein